MVFRISSSVCFGRFVSSQSLVFFVMSFVVSWFVFQSAVYATAVKNSERDVYPVLFILRSSFCASVSLIRMYDTVLFAFFPMFVLRFSGWLIDDG